MSNVNRAKTQLADFVVDNGVWNTAGDATLNATVSITQIGNNVTVTIPALGDSLSTAANITIDLNTADGGYDAALAARMLPAIDGAVVPLIINNDGTVAAGRVAVSNNGGVVRFTVTTISGADLSVTESDTNTTIVGPQSFTYQAAIVAGWDNQS